MGKGASGKPDRATHEQSPQAVSAVPEGIPSAWDEMDAWCAARTAGLQERVARLILRDKVDLDNRELRHLVGQSDAFHRMRSYIHGARQAAEDLPEGGEDWREVSVGLDRILDDMERREAFDEQSMIPSLRLQRCMRATLRMLMRSNSAAAIISTGKTRWWSRLRLWKVRQPYSKRRISRAKSRAILCGRRAALMTELHTRYDRRADVLYLFTDHNGPAVAREDPRGIVWRYLDDNQLVGATIIDFHELWSGRMTELARALATEFRLPPKHAAKVLASADG